MIRPFELRDIPMLHGYRKRGQFLDSIPTLTWGDELIPVGAAASPFSGATGVFTSVAVENEHETMIGQAGHTMGSPFAHLTFLAPDEALDSPAFSPLIEHLIQQVGARGAQSLVAEVDEKSHTFEALRRASFSIYSRQRIWRVEKTPADAVGRGGSSQWRQMNEIDEFNIRRLYNILVPGLVQQVEPALWGKPAGRVLQQGDDLMAFVDIKQGPRGIWAQPFIHPELDQIDTHLAALLHDLKPGKSRPIYLCLRSYASWLSAPVEEVGAQPGPAQAVMVRRLTVGIKKMETGPLPELNGGGQPAGTGTFSKLDEA